jgi:hypothetical protein
MHAYPIAGGLHEQLFEDLLGALMAAALSLPAVAQTGKDRQLAETICDDQSGAAMCGQVRRQISRGFADATYPEPPQGVG